MTTMSESTTGAGGGGCSVAAAWRRSLAGARILLLLLLLEDDRDALDLGAGVGLACWLLASAWHGSKRLTLLY